MEALGDAIEENNSGSSMFPLSTAWFYKAPAYHGLRVIKSHKHVYLRRRSQKPACQGSWDLLSWPLQFSSVQSLSRVRLFATPWTAACQDSLSVTNSQSPPKPMSVESVMPSNHLILCHPLLLLPSVFPTIRVFSNESALCIRWPLEFQLQHQLFQWASRTDLL